MKKIFHFVSTNILSGLENMVVNISTLVNGYNYTYVSPDGPINDYLCNLGIKHISIKKMTPWDVRKVLKQYNPDIVQGHDVKASISLAFNHSICKKKNIKIISELHNDDPRMHKLTLRSELYRLSTKYYYKVICVSKSVIDNYIFSNDIKYKSTVINNVINPSRIKSNIKGSNNNWDCIFIGRLVSLESLMIGTPVIASPVGGLKDIIDDNCGYLALNNSDFINKSYKLLNDDDIYTYKSKHGIIKTKKINNTDKFINLYKTIYDD